MSAVPNCEISFALSTITPAVPGVKAGVALLGISTVTCENVLARRCGGESLPSEQASSRPFAISRRSNLVNEDIDGLSVIDFGDHLYIIGNPNAIFNCR
jgi:hypothetical protein